MRRAVLVAPRQFEIQEVPIPDPGPEDCILQVEQSGICGSDIHFYKGESSLQLPVVPGHEFAGTVVACGSAVKEVKVGDRVTAEPGIQCGVCAYCRSGRYNLCVDAYTIGARADHDGGYADYVRVPAKKLVPLPKGMSFETGAMVEPVACAMHALDVAEIVPGSTVMVIGAGTIGLLVAQAARIAGAVVVAVADVVEERLALAKQLGADAVVNAAECDLADWALEKYGEGGVPRVFDAAGTSKTVNQAIQLVSRGERVIIIGVATQAIPIDTNLILLRELVVTGMDMYTRPNFTQALEVLQEGRMNVAPLISASYPLARVSDAFERILKDPQHTIKMLLAPRAG